MLHITKGEKEIVSKRESTSFSTVYFWGKFLSILLFFHFKVSLVSSKIPQKVVYFFFFSNAFHCELREKRDTFDFVRKIYLNFRAKTITLKIYMCHLSYSKIWKKMNFLHLLFYRLMDRKVCIQILGKAKTSIESLKKCAVDRRKSVYNGL